MKPVQRKAPRNFLAPRVGIATGELTGPGA